MTMKEHQNKLLSEPVTIRKFRHVIADMPIETLKPAERNARTHSRKQIKQIRESIQRFGFVGTVLVDRKLRIVAGHGRVQAAKELGMTHVPGLMMHHLTPAEVKALALADNKIAANAGWDEELLKAELQEIQCLDPEMDLSITGFSLPEIDDVFDASGAEEAGNPKEDTLPALAPDEPVTRLGDVWELDSHRLICGDSLSPKVCAALMGADKARMVFTDPPYNVPIAGHVSGLGDVQHREFAMAAGEMTPEQFTAFLTTACANMAAVCADGAIAYVCMDWRHMDEMRAAGKAAFAEAKNLIVWVKDNGGMGTFYRSRHELIFVYKVGTAPHVNNFELGQHGRYRTNCWQYRGMNAFGAGRDDALALHPTVKPVGMIADAIKDVSGRGDIVLDMFGGSGSTLIAAHKTARRARLCELDPVYCDRIVRRWEAFARDDAILQATGQTFEEVMAERMSNPAAE